MGYLTKVQTIKRKKSEQWYINFPSAVAQALDFAQSEEGRVDHPRQGPSDSLSPGSAA